MHTITMESNLGTTQYKLMQSWVLCQLYHALRQPTRPVSTPLSVRIVKKVGGPKAEPPKRVRNRDVIHVTGITNIPDISTQFKTHIHTTHSYSGNEYNVCSAYHYIIL